MAAVQEQLLFISFSFSLLVTILYAPTIVRLLVLFGLSYICYIWSCVYLQDVHIYLTAAWNARHFPQLSETCANIVNIKVPERHKPWYEQWLHCSGELWGQETWRSYRDYTSPHFLLLYIAVFLFIYLVIKCGRRRLNDTFDNQPPAIDDSPAAPGAYHTFSHSYVANLEAALSSRIAELTSELETSKQRERENRAGSLICRVLKKALHEKEVSKLKRPNKAEQRQFWELKSPASHSRLWPATSLLKAPTQAGKPAVPSNTARKLTVKSAASTRCDSQEDAEKPALQKNSQGAKEGRASSKAEASSASNTSRDTAEKSTLTNMVNQLRVANQELASKIEDLEATNAAIEPLKADYARVLKQNSTLILAEQDLEVANSKLERLNTENQELVRFNNHLTTTADGNNGPLVSEVNRLTIDNSAYLEENRALKRMFEQFNAQKIALEDTKQKLNFWGLESNKQRNEIINDLRPKIRHLEQANTRLQKQIADDQQAHDEYVRGAITRVNGLEDEKRRLQLTQTSAAPQTEIGRLQRLLSTESSARRTAGQQIRALQNTVAAFDQERIIHQRQVEKLKQDNVNLARSQLAYSEDDEVRQLKKDIYQLKTAANRTDVQLKAADEKFGKAKEAATTQIKKLRTDVKEKDQLLKETEDLIKAAEQRSEEFKQLRGDLADKEKQLQVVNSKLEAAEVARDYLKSKGLEAAKEYQDFRENHAKQAHTGFGAGEDDATEKRGRDCLEGDENGGGGGRQRPKEAAGVACSLVNLIIGRKSSSSYILS
jgi:hypothetical protein